MRVDMPEPVDLLRRSLIRVWSVQPLRLNTPPLSGPMWLWIVWPLASRRLVMPLCLGMDRRKMFDRTVLWIERALVSQGQSAPLCLCKDHWFELQAVEEKSATALVEPLVPLRA